MSCIQKPYSAYKALVVGISQYADPQYDLDHALNDAEAVARVLREEYGFDHIETLYNDQATRANIIHYFEQELQLTNEDDGVFVFFAGHGITVTSAIGDERGFLIPYDGNPDQPYANISLGAIRDDYLVMAPAKHVFIVLDCCYGGLALRDIGTKQTVKTIDEQIIADLTRRDRKVRQVLSAGMKDQQVLDGGLHGHSIFTGRFLEALQQSSSWITADHVGLHVKTCVARDAMDRHCRQTPQYGLVLGSDGTFVFVPATIKMSSFQRASDTDRPVFVSAPGSTASASSTCNVDAIKRAILEGDLEAALQQLETLEGSPEKTALTALMAMSRGAIHHIPNQKAQDICQSLFRVYSQSNDALCACLLQIMHEKYYQRLSRRFPTSENGWKSIKRTSMKDDDRQLLEMVSEN